jgi:LPS-assembly protein
MPPLMLHWRPLHITILSLGSFSSLAWAADPPLCPSSMPSLNRSAPASKAPATGQPPGKPPKLIKETKPGVDDGVIDMTSQNAHADVTDQILTLQGNVKITQGTREIHADEIEYNKNTNRFKTDSGMEYEDPVVKLSGNGGSYSPTEGANLKSATFELQQRAARGAADTLQLSPKGIIDLQGVRFTTCPVTEEAWHILAKTVTLDTTTQIGVARSAQVDFQGVPIMYLPWLSFPLGDQRKSGFLYPTIGNNSRSGASISVPYYWNIAPNADFTFEPIEYSKRGPDLGGDLRFLTANDHGELLWNYLPYDSVFNASRSRIKLTNILELPDNFRFSIDAETVSDTSYFEDFAVGPEGTSTAFVQQQATVTYRDEHLKVDAEVQHYQTTDNTLAEVDRPYARLPRLAASADYGIGPAGAELKYGFESEIVNFDRSVGVTGWRIDMMPEASLDFEAPGWFIRPGIAWRSTQYELDNLSSWRTIEHGVPVYYPNDLLSFDMRQYGDLSPSRNLPIASFDTGLMFERDVGSHDQRVVTLEPRMLYLYVPYRYQDQLPIFDTGLPDLDPVELFRNNRYVGGDRVGDADQVSVGITSRLLDAHDGKQFLSATFGQTYYFTDPRVLLPTEVPVTDHRSDFVAQLALTAFKHWSADIALQWDPQTSQSERTEVNVQYKPANDAVINVDYRFQRDVLQQAEISSAWPVANQWDIFVRGVYSIKDGKPLERFAGFEYRACCWKARLGGRSFVSNRTGAEDTGIYLQLELTGLASVGSESDSFLSESIRGYTPENATQKLRALDGP